ncbi:MoaF-related domain-containing protein [Myroides injenensis]|uniref:MoaF-related domain-containing protein n=1 Tax=Myroides injenensis TaxID=1183151 RepID=UPI00028891EB|nr:hypothetical protein [Myroides injenensis]
MKKVLLLLTLMLGITLVSCQTKQTKEETSLTEVKSDSVAKEAETKYLLIGRKGEIQFPEMKATIEYTSETSLHWSTVGKDGKINEGDEKLSYKRLSDELYFLNWIEQDGFTVNQVINTKTGEVTAFWSYNDENGQRASSFVTGTFKYVD